MSLESMQAVLRRQDRFRTIVTVLLLIWLIVLWFMGDPKKTAPLPAVADQAAAIADLEHDAQPKAELESAVTETETSADAASVDSSAVAEQPEQTAGAAEDNAPDSIGNLMLSAADASSDADSHSEPAQEPEPAALSVVAPTTTEESASAALAEETVTPQGERQPTESVDEPVMPAEEPLAASEPQAHEVAKSMGPLVSSVVGHQDSRPSSATSPEPETSTASVDTPEVPTGSAVTKEPTSPAPPYEEQAGPVPENGTPYGRMVRRMGKPGEPSGMDVPSRRSRCIGRAQISTRKTFWRWRKWPGCTPMP